MIFTLVLVICLLVLSAFFSAAEAAMLSSSRANLFALAKAGDRNAALVLKMMDKPESLLATILMCNNVLNIGSSALMTGLFIALFGAAGMAYATAMMTIIILIFGEILPKTLGTRYPDKLSMTLALPLKLFIWVCLPLTMSVNLINRLVLRLFGIKEDAGRAISAAELRGTIHLSLQQGGIKDTQYKMLDAILDLDSLTVGDVMLHRKAIDALDVDTIPAEIPARLAKIHHTRIPVYEGSAENIIGILTVRNYLEALAAAPNRHAVTIRSHLQQAYYVPETTLVGHQLRTFLTTQRHMALVVDEYGSLQGLLTLEDILEEIVGDMTPEGAVGVKFPKPATDGSVVLAGDTPLRTVNRHYGWELPYEEAVTLAGLMMERLGHLPVQGESVDCEGLQLTVVDKRGHKIHGIRVKPDVAV